MIILDGKKLSQELKLGLIKKFKKKPAQLVIFNLGNDPASDKYVSLKQKMGEEMGVKVIVEDSLDTFDFYNSDVKTTGLMVQLPLPPNMNKEELLAKINPKKDVDGLNSKSGIQPATVVGILELLEFYKIDFDDENVVIINDSNLIGKPMAKAIIKYTKNIAICNKHTPSLQSICNNADILITATGVSNLIDSTWIKQGCVIIDVGYPGDVNFNSVKDKVYAITPVPGGVGPMTVISLFQNLYNLL